MAGDLLVRGGTLVDGTGARATRADVRVRDRVIVETGANLEPDGEPQIDAGGAIVAPGFIDCHTHYDPSVWWDPLVDPMPQHGVTTVVTGQLLALADAGPRCGSRPRRRRVRVHRRHSGRCVRDRYSVDVGVVRRVERCAADARHGGEHRGARRSLEPARLRDGRRCLGARGNPRRNRAAQCGARRVCSLRALSDCPRRSSTPTATRTLCRAALPTPTSSSR